MQVCLHEDLEFVGEQKTDEGANKYWKCKSCGSTVVTTAAKKAFSIRPIAQTNQAGPS